MANICCYKGVTKPLIQDLNDIRHAFYDEIMDDVRQIFYDEDEEIYIDDRGVIIDNIFRVVDPNMIYLWKLNRDSRFVYGVHGEYLELIFEEKGR